MHARDMTRVLDYYALTMLLCMYRTAPKPYRPPKHRSIRKKESDMYDFYVIRDIIGDAKLVSHSKYTLENLQGEIIFKGTKYECRIFVDGFNQGQESCTSSY
jgi:hypothetical protein